MYLRQVGLIHKVASERRGRGVEVLHDMWTAGGYKQDIARCERDLSVHAGKSKRVSGHSQAKATCQGWSSASQGCRSAASVLRKT